MIGITNAGMGSFIISATAPADTTKLWIDTGTYSGYAILKYYNGASWVAISSVYS